MIVMTRWVTDGSAGSGECIDMPMFSGLFLSDVLSE
jgi:hypothetical protein